MRYVGFRCLEGRRAGCVDFLEVIDAPSLTDAERYFESTYEFDFDEHLSIEDDDDDPAPNTR